MWGDFFETQIHGGVGWADVERVDFEEAPFAEVSERLDALGIPWTVGGPAPVRTEGLERFPTVKELIGPDADARNYQPLDSDGEWLMGGGCVHLAIAMKEVFPEGKIAVSWYDDRGGAGWRTRCSTTPRPGRRMTASESTTIRRGGDLRGRARPTGTWTPIQAELAEHMGIHYNPEAPFEDDGIMDAWMFAERHFLPEWARVEREDEDEVWSEGIVRTEGVIPEIPTRLWHVTADPNFQIEERRQGGVLHLTDDGGVAAWSERLTWPRPRKYAAEIEVDDPSQIARTLTPEAREWQVRSSAARVARVVPLAKALGDVRTEGPERYGPERREGRSRASRGRTRAGEIGTLDALLRNPDLSREDRLRYSHELALLRAEAAGESVHEVTLPGRAFSLLQEAPPRFLLLRETAVEQPVGPGTRHRIRATEADLDALQGWYTDFAREHFHGDRRSDARAASDAVNMMRRDIGGPDPVRSDGITNPASLVDHEFLEVEPVPGPDVGIHSTGGYGASETLRDQYEASGTGGFGSGFYYVSGPEQLRGYTYGPEGDRRVVGIDLTGKRLYRPASADHAFKLHDWLMDVNYHQHTDTDLDATIQRLKLEELAVNAPVGLATAPQIRRAIEGARG